MIHVIETVIFALFITTTALIASLILLKRRMTELKNVTDPLIKNKKLRQTERYKAIIYVCLPEYILPIGIFIKLNRILVIIIVTLTLSIWIYSFIKVFRIRKKYPI